MRLWKRKPEAAPVPVIEPKPKIILMLPPKTLAFGLDSNGKIEICLQWPVIESREHEEAFAKEYAGMIASVVRKDIIPYVQTVIAAHGVKSGSERLSNLILINLNVLLNPEVVDDDAPVISPEEAFQVRGNN